MGCTNSSQKPASAPTLLTSKSIGNVVEKGAKQLIPDAKEELHHGQRPQELPENGQFKGALEDVTLEAKTLPPEHYEGIPSPADLQKSLEHPRPPVDTIKSLDTLTDPSPPAANTLDINTIPSPLPSAMESFASSHSGYSASTNFTFGHKWTPPQSTRSLLVGRNSGLLTLQEDAPLAEATESAGKERHVDTPESCLAPGLASHEDGHGHQSLEAPVPCEATEEVSEDSVAHVQRVVEKTVHALVDAGEDAWDHVRSAWNDRYSMLTPIQEETEVDLDAEENASERSWHRKPLRAFGGWQCVSD